MFDIVIFMENINRLKLVFVEKEKQVNSWQNNWENIRQSFLNGAQM